MKLKAILVFFCSLTFLTTKAQLYTLGIGPELNVPSGNSSNISAIGFGAALKAEIGLSPKVGLTANGGLTSFYGKRFFNVRSPREVSIPLKGGFKYYPSEYFYLEGQIGTNIPVSGNANMGFAWSPGIGSYLKLRNSENKLDIGLRYEGWSSSRTITATNTTFSTFSFIGLRLAYAFNLK